MVPSVSVLSEFHCLIKSNICQTVVQTSCEIRTVSWKLTTKTDCDVQELRCCQYSVDYIFCTVTLIPELMLGENYVFPAFLFISVIPLKSILVFVNLAYLFPDLSLLFH